MPRFVERAASAVRWVVLLPVRIWSLFRAVSGGKDESLVFSRLAICRSCEFVRPQEYIDDETLQKKQRLHCGQCGCGTTALAELHNKLKYIDLACPIGKWGKDGALTPKQASMQLAAERRAEWETKNPELAAKMKAQQDARAAAHAQQRAVPGFPSPQSSVLSPEQLHLHAADGQRTPASMIPEDEFQSTFRRAGTPGLPVRGQPPQAVNKEPT